MSYDFDWSSIPGALPFLWQGMGVTLEITAVAVLAGIAWGTLLALMRLSGVKWLAWVAAGYVNLFRSIPLVMLLLWHGASWSGRSNAGLWPDVVWCSPQPHRQFNPADGVGSTHLNNDK